MYFFFFFVEGGGGGGGRKVSKGAKIRNRYNQVPRHFGGGGLEERDEMGVKSSQKRTILGVIFMHFRVFSKGQGTEWVKLQIFFEYA